MSNKASVSFFTMARLFRNEASLIGDLLKTVRGVGYSKVKSDAGRRSKAPALRRETREQFIFMALR